MRKMIMILVLGLCMSCAEDQISHIETAEIVAESFVSRDNESLKKHTTSRQYNRLLSIQGLITSTYEGKTNFRLIRDTVLDDTAWVKFSTAHEKKPETFKLIKENGRWKVTEIGMGEQGPF